MPTAGGSAVPSPAPPNPAQGKPVRLGSASRTAWLLPHQPSLPQCQQRVAPLCPPLPLPTLPKASPCDWGQPVARHSDNNRGSVRHSAAGGGLTETAGGGVVLGREASGSSGGWWWWGGGDHPPANHACCLPLLSETDMLPLLCFCSSQRTSRCFFMRQSGRSGHVRCIRIDLNVYMAINGRNPAQAGGDGKHTITFARQPGLFKSVDCLPPDGPSQQTHPPHRLSFHCVS